MKKHKFLIWNIITLVSLSLIYIGFSLLLSCFHLAFTHYITYSVIVICYLLSLSLIVQMIILLFKTASHKKQKRQLCIMFRMIAGILSLCFAYALLSTPIIAAFLYKPAHIVKKHNTIMIAYVESFSQVEIYYYELKNIFVQGKSVKIYENCGNGGNDPFKNNNTPYVYRATYYDDKGHIMREYDRDTDGEYQ